MKRWLVIAAAVAFGLSAAILVRRIPSANQHSDSLREVVVAIERPPTTLDPAHIVEVGSLAVALAIHAPLAVVDSTGLVQYVLANAIEMTNDAKSCVIALRGDIHFWDGAPVTAEDVIGSMERLRRASHPHAWILDEVTGIGAFDRHEAEHIEGLKKLSASTLEITFSAPDPDFVRFVSSSALLITKHLAEDSPAQTYDTQIIGCGPFRPAKIDPGTRIRMERNTGFPFKSTLQSLTFDVVESQQAQLAGLQAGTYHIVRLRGPILGEAVKHTSTGEVQLADRFGSASVKSSRANELVFLSFNFSRGPLNTISNSGRQAWLHSLSSSFDRERLADGEYFGLAQPAFSVVPPTVLAGETHDNGMHLQELEPATVELLCGNDSDSRRLGQFVQTSAQRVGINFRLVHLELSQLAARLIGGQHEAALLWIENQVPAGIIPWTNFFRKDHPMVALAQPVEGVKEAQAEARNTLDTTDRVNAYRQLVHKIDAVQTAWIPLITRDTVYLVDKRLDGVFLDANGVLYFQSLTAKQ